MHTAICQSLHDTARGEAEARWRAITKGLSSEAIVAQRTDNEGGIEPTGLPSCVWAGNLSLLAHWSYWKLLRCCLCFSCSSKLAVPYV